MNINKEITETKDFPAPEKTSWAIFVSPLDAHHHHKRLRQGQEVIRHRVR